MKLIIIFRNILIALVAFVAFCLLFIIIDYNIDDVVYSLPKYENSEKYSSTDRGTKIKYNKFYYSDITDDELNKNPFLAPVTEKDITSIRSHVSHYERYACNNSELMEVYDFDKGMVEKGDYFYLDSLDIYMDDYGDSDYRIYYFDVETHTLYYFYNKMNIKPN